MSPFNLMITKLNATDATMAKQKLRSMPFEGGPIPKNTTTDQKAFMQKMIPLPMPSNVASRLEAPITLHEVNISSQPPGNLLAPLTMSEKNRSVFRMDPQPP